MRLNSAYLPQGPSPASLEANPLSPTSITEAVKRSAKVPFAQGRQGSLYHCCIKGRAFAVKQLSTYSRSTEREVNLTINLPPHPHLVRGVESYEQDGNTGLVLDYVPGPSLEKHMQTTGSSVFTGFQGSGGMKRIQQFCKQMLHVIAHLHKHGVVHRDIKPANICMVQKEKEVDYVLVDLGLSRSLRTKSGLFKPIDGEEEPAEGRFSPCGTRDYLAPEISQRIRRSITFSSPEIAYNERVDIWSFGKTLDQLTGREPQQVCKELRVFINRCLINFADARPSAEELLQDPFLDQNF